MTLILTFVTPYYTLQVSDRLVTRQGIEFDPMANKNVIFKARNALVTIGYTGLAYLDGVPTDHWVVEQLTDQQLPLACGAQVTAGYDRQFEDIGQCLRRLQGRLVGSFSAAGTPKMEQTFVVAGFMWKRHRLRPIALSIGNSLTAPGLFLQDHVPRHEIARKIENGERKMRSGLMVVPDSNTTVFERESWRDQAARVANNADAVEEILVSAIRSVASHSSVVGRDCMSILIGHPTWQGIRIRYRPLITMGVTVPAFGEQPFPAGVSPWLVGPRIIQQPFVFIGGWPGDLSGTPYVVQTPPNPGGRGLLGGMFPQRRVPDPLQRRVRQIDIDHPPPPGMA